MVSHKEIYVFNLPQKHNKGGRLHDYIKLLKRHLSPIDSEQFRKRIKYNQIQSKISFVLH